MLQLGGVSSPARHARLGQAPTRESLCHQMQYEADYKVRLGAVLNLLKAARNDPDAGWYINSCLLAGLGDPASTIRTASALAIAELAPRADTQTRTATHASVFHIDQFRIGSL